MTGEWRQTLTTILLAGLGIAAMVGLAWWSMVGLVLVTLAALLGLAVGWYLGVRHAAAQAAQTRRARRRNASAGSSRKRG